MLLSNLSKAESVAEDVIRLPRTQAELRWQRVDPVKIDNIIYCIAA